jgi:DNA-binding NarL/FixJ family response regulator
VRIAVIEDDAAYRHGLEELVRNAPGFSLSASFASAEAALDALRRAQETADVAPWDLVLMDVGLPRMSGIDATRELKRLAPGLLVVVLTVFEQSGTILQAICAGADGYLLKRTPAAEILEQLRALTAGGAALTSGVARQVLDMLRRSAHGELNRFGAVPVDLGLTPREHDVLRGLVDGLGYKEIALRLGIGLDTVRTHVRGVYRKLQVHSVARAVSRAIQEGLV